MPEASCANKNSPETGPALQFLAGDGEMARLMRAHDWSKTSLGVPSEWPQALRQAQKMEAVGQLTGGLAHDFNNLLAGISGSIEVIDELLKRGRLSDIERYMGAAQNSTRRAAALTQRLLAFSRRQTLDPRPTDANLLARPCWWSTTSPPSGC